MFIKWMYLHSSLIYTFYIYVIRSLCFVLRIDYIVDWVSEEQIDSWTMVLQQKEFSKITSA